MIAQLQLRKDTKANWETVNPVLANGELGIEFTGNEARIKAGNGVKRWMDLNYISADDGQSNIINTALQNHINNTGNAHGIDTIQSAIANIEIEIDNLDNKIKNVDVVAIKGSVDKYSQLPPASSMPDKAAYIVEEDENKGNASSIYMAVGSAWIFVAKFNVDLSNYYTKPDIDTKINTTNTKFNSYYTKTETDGKITTINNDINTTNSKFGNYYTKTETDSKDTIINNRFNGYYTKTETDNKVDTVDDKLSNYYTKPETDGKDANINNKFSSYYTKPETDIKFNSYYTKTETDGKINNTDTKLNNYYTKTETDSKDTIINNKFSGYFTKTETNTKLNSYYTKTEADSKINGTETKLNNYYTKPEIDYKIDTIEDDLENKMKVIAIRGGVKTYADLPDINNERIGDAYIVERDENNYGISVIYAVADFGGVKKWVYVAQFIVDLTNYYNKEEIQELFLDKYYTNDEIDNKLVIIEDKIVLLNNDLLNYYTKQVIDDKVNTIDTEITTHNTNTTDAHGIDTIKNDISDLQTKVENMDVISIKGSVDTYAGLPDNTDLLIGTAYIVEKDENKNNITTIYAVEDNAGVKSWVFIGEFKVDLSNYYNKNEVDELVEDVDLTDYYNKEQINNKLEDYNISVNGLLTMGPPDYANRESVNRMPAVNSVYTADRNGYVSVLLAFKATGTASNMCSITINSQDMEYGRGNEAGTNSGDGCISTILPVKIGDVVRFYLQPNVQFTFGQCFFIPPVINPPIKLEAQPLLDYSTVEQDTGRKWIDGKPIYQKTYNFTTGSAATWKAIDSSFIITGTLIDYTGAIHHANGLAKIPHSEPNFENYIWCNEKCPWHKTMNAEYSNRPAHITFWYTK